MSSAEMANKNSSEATLVAIFREYRNLSWSERLLGKYDYRQLCTPVLIGNETENRSTFFGKDEPIPILLAILMGFQHALGSVGGNVLIVTLATFGAPPTIRQATRCAQTHCHQSQIPHAHTIPASVPRSARPALAQRDHSADSTLPGCAGNTSCPVHSSSPASCRCFRSPLFRFLSPAGGFRSAQACSPLSAPPPPLCPSS
mmetsp:Transcript_42670/g.107899  ORF Transcript_42670/g.107899 Transcript_42670/m.107899 type:complete len:201 (-) Transcript_42670:1126-1728(-)